MLNAVWAIHSPAREPALILDTTYAIKVWAKRFALWHGHSRILVGASPIDLIGFLLARLF
jgi:hypothetical protein